jgi:hypothetical protein
MNLKSIADGIAAAFGTLTVNGESATATASLPDDVGRIALLVYPPTGSLDVGTSARRDDVYAFPVRLLRDPLSTPARTAALYAWFNAMRDLVEANIDLGLSYVSYAQPTDCRLAIDGQRYGLDGLYDVVELTVQVRVNEHVATVA